MDVSALIAELTERRKQYQVQAVTSIDPDYWDGKASGLLLAIEIITAHQGRKEQDNYPIKVD